LKYARMHLYSEDVEKEEQVHSSLTTTTRKNIKWKHLPVLLHLYTELRW